MVLGFIFDNADTLVWANEEARRILGLPEQCDRKIVAATFGSSHIYHQIEQEAFNYRWAGNLSVILPNGDRTQLLGRASWVTNERCVFNQIFLEGTLNAEELFESSDNEAEVFAVQPAQLRKVYEISTSINSNLDFQSYA